MELLLIHDDNKKKKKFVMSDYSSVRKCVEENIKNKIYNPNFILNPLEYQRIMDKSNVHVIFIIKKLRQEIMKDCVDIYKF